ncbi:hypothetical protein [Micromonospora narathiwatensis]|uniref:Uncharacterized protein n=1 Tax=Micromonospora narathiwatensis TaxID=299146 RepID=A0A1A8ZYB6_9ACTN|nr:hypothetical protein [Micromonospora narathiwatensis]SBT48874.1 hypothetical protein GA0070621_3292 [Micromonospora narathiwatensis]
MLKLSGLALVVAVTVAVTLLAVDRRREADAHDGVRWCHQKVIERALENQKATSSAEVRFLGEQFVVGQNHAGQRAIEVDGGVAIAGVESRYSCGREYTGDARFGYLTVHWADDEGTRQS